jgi:hypothetical protein
MGHSEFTVLKGGGGVVHCVEPVETKCWAHHMKAKWMVCRVRRASEQMSASRYLWRFMLPTCHDNLRYLPRHRVIPKKLPVKCVFNLDCPLISQYYTICFPNTQILSIQYKIYRIFMIGQRGASPGIRIKILHDLWSLPYVLHIQPISFDYLSNCLSKNRN